MIYFLLYLFIEVFVSVNIASVIGPIWTFVEIIASAMLGFFILARFQYKSSEYLMALARKEITIEEFESLNLYTLLGAFLLIIPGFFTDIIGILLQFGVFAKFFASKILHLRKKPPKDEGDDNVIDVEIIER
ncbi:FxsA family protein [Nitrosophilus alvini]|uniref:FxsA family protein n=1 Tax=Nitrosophilus alvini TaxID=2714855 RepID=UPI0019099BCC|nr:FxsA family protein [Nitrosophilus alvini]